MVSSSAVRNALQSTALLFTLFAELGQEEGGNWESSTFCHFTFTPLPETHCPSEFSAEPVCQFVSTCPLTFLFLLSSSLWVDTFKFLSVFRAKGVVLSSVGRVKQNPGFKLEQSIKTGCVG